MSTIYVDVGSRGGQQINWALPFVDFVYGFEPSPRSFNEMRPLFIDNPRVILYNCGMWNKTCDMEMFNDGAAGGTIFSDFQSTGPVRNRAMVTMVKASSWFRDNLNQRDKIILKLNCEGSECDILNDLLDSGEYSKVHTCLVDFDVRKCPSKKHEEPELMARLKSLGINNVFPYMMINDNHPTLDRKILWKKVFGGEQQ